MIISDNFPSIKMDRTEQADVPSSFQGFARYGKIAPHSQYCREGESYDTDRQSNSGAARAGGREKTESALCSKPDRIDAYRRVPHGTFRLALCPQTWRDICAEN